MNRSWPLAYLAVLCFTISAQASPAPPEPEPEPTPAMVRVRLEEVGKVAWDIDRNVVHSRELEAVAVDGLTTIGWFYDPPEKADGDDAKPAGPPFHLYRTKDGKMVVDARVFSTLTRVRAIGAEKLGAEGAVVGRILAKEYDPADLAQFLVVTGIVDANLHVIAGVEGSVSRADDGSHWFELRSEDPYWTNKANVAHYGFGIEIAADGTIRVYNPKYHGRRIVEKK